MELILQTARLQLRPFTLADLDVIYEMNSDPEVMRFIFDGKIQTKAESAAYLRKIIEHYPKTPKLGAWAIELRASREFVGIACLRQFEQPEKRELGYRLHRAHWGKGFATEISKGLVHYGFETLNLPQIMAVVEKENSASRAVLEKAGLIHSGSGHYYGFDLEYYELTNPKHL